MPTKKKRKPEGPAVMMTFRAPPSLVAMLDAEVVRQCDEEPGRRITRADVIRGLVYAALSRPKR